MGNKESTLKQYTIEEIFTKDITDKLITLEYYRALYLILEYDNIWPMLNNSDFIASCQDIKSIQTNIVNRYFNDRIYNYSLPYCKDRLIKKINTINALILYVIKIIFYQNTGSLYKKIEDVVKTNKVKINKVFVECKPSGFSHVLNTLRESTMELETTIIMLKDNDDIGGLKEFMCLIELEKNNKYLKEKNEALQIKYDTLEAEINKYDTLEAENKKLEEKNEELRDTIEGLCKKNKALQTKCDTLEAENAKLRERVKILDESNF
jgi:hypothetical protein